MYHDLGQSGTIWEPLESTEAIWGRLGHAQGDHNQEFNTFELSSNALNEIEFIEL